MRFSFCHRYVGTLLLACTFVFAASCTSRPHYAGSPETERTMFIGEKSGHYTVVSVDVWGKNGKFALPCNNCEPMFVTGGAKNNAFISVKTGQSLATPPNSTGRTNTLLTHDNAVTDSVWITFCPRGETPTWDGCWWPMNIMVRDLESSRLVWSGKMPGGDAGDLFDVLKVFNGAVFIINANDKDKVLAKIRSDELLAAQEENDKIRQLRADRLAEAQAAKNREDVIESEDFTMRQTIKVGTQTNCGQVFDVRLPMVGVQTPVGIQYIEVNRLYSPGRGCTFVNGVYQGIR
jgi:hypothetical protein